jgi:hypothetical protein
VSRTARGNVSSTGDGDGGASDASSLSASDLLSPRASALQKGGNLHETLRVNARRRVENESLSKDSMILLLLLIVYFFAFCGFGDRSFLFVVFWFNTLKKKKKKTKKRKKKKKKKKKTRKQKQTHTNPPSLCFQPHHSD